MFAVPGWAVSADSLRTQTSEKAGKKRRRDGRRVQSGPDSKITVTDENVAELWDSLVEKQRHDAESLSPGSLTKNQRRDAETTAPAPSSHGSPKDKPELQGQRKLHTKKDKKREKKEKLKLSHATSAPVPAPAAGDAPAPFSAAAAESSISKPSPTKIPEQPKSTEQSKVKGQINLAKNETVPSNPNLTPLQSQMAQKLLSSRFRHLNQSLYTTTSTAAMDLFRNSPDAFTDYHAGFARQVSTWPENPIDLLVQRIISRAAIQPAQSAPAHKRRKTNPPPAQSFSSGLAPLPRSANGTCTISDHGSGPGTLAQTLHALSAPTKHNLLIHSFDLLASPPYVTKADIANVPLDSGTVDIVVLSLALMGTNWPDFVSEAARVVRGDGKGEIWIVEVASRFAGQGAKGKEKEMGGGKKRKTSQGDDEDDEQDQNPNADLDSFTDLCAARGLELVREEVQRNKMFVSMRFTRRRGGAGGNVVTERGKGKAVRGSGNGKYKGNEKRTRNENEEGHNQRVEESQILKPCLYKLR